MRVTLFAAATLLVGCDGIDPAKETQSVQFDQQTNDAPSESRDSPEVLTDNSALDFAIDEQVIENFFEQQQRFPWNGLSMPDEPLANRNRELQLEFLDEPRRLQDWMNCDGYITNNADSDFCEETVPDNWVQFNFNGNVYYYVPLRG